MKVFKTTACLLCTILIFFSRFAAFPAEAQTARYAYADLGSEVYICSEKNEDSALFIVPQTYCVEILGDDGTWYYVKYAEDNDVYRAVYGYCLKGGLVLTETPLENLYLNVTLKVIFRNDQPSGYLPPLEMELTAAYYGEYNLGKTKLSYVYCGEKFGYVTERVENYPLNDLPQPTVGPIDDKPDDGNAMLIAALTITLAAAAAIAVLYFSGRHKPS